MNKKSHAEQRLFYTETKLNYFTHTEEFARCSFVPSFPLGLNPYSQTATAML